MTTKILLLGAPISEMSTTEEVFLSQRFPGLPVSTFAIYGLTVCQPLDANLYAYELRRIKPDLVLIPAHVPYSKFLSHLADGIVNSLNIVGHFMTGLNDGSVVDIGKIRSIRPLQLQFT